MPVGYLTLVKVWAMNKQVGNVHVQGFGTIEI